MKLHHLALAMAMAVTAPVVATPSMDARSRDDSGALLFSAMRVEMDDTAQVRALAAQAPATDGPRLHLLKFSGAVQPEWLAALTAHGITPVHYVPDNGYLVWADPAGLERLGRIHTAEVWLAGDLPYAPVLKVDPLLTEQARHDPAGEVEVVVQIYRHDDRQASRQWLESLARIAPGDLGPVGDGRIRVQWTPVLGYENAVLRVMTADLPLIAERPDVVWVGKRQQQQLFDEKQNLILTGDFSPAAGSPRYLPFLLERGFSDDPDDYPIVDVTDQPIHEGGTGVTAMNTADQTLRRQGDPLLASRVSYFNNCSPQLDERIGDTGGHGTINASIIGGFDLRTGHPHQDGDGHQRGLGVNPFVRLGSTALFTPNFSVAGCGGSLASMLDGIWQQGARVSSHSWGSSAPPLTYDDQAQIFDIAVRDADPEQPLDQQLALIVAAGNHGAGGPATIASPGTAKNVITVGASENLRPQWLDGCGLPPEGADNPHDIANFSSRGPAAGSLTKPEVVAPGTHVQGAASVYADYVGNAVCDSYYPPGQTIYAASSGTSHSTPAVAGIASLAWWWIERNGLGRIDRADDSAGAPSPALIKSWLMAHPSYLAGFSSNDTLPSNNQGYGMPNLSEMFDDSDKVVLDQRHVFTASGQQWQANWQAADITRPVRIALTWTDAPGLLGTFYSQVNDLDLTVTVGGQTYRGNHFLGQWSQPGGGPDQLNTHEAVFLPAGTSGELIVTVDASNIAGPGVPSLGPSPSQDFALVCSNCAQMPGFILRNAIEPEHACTRDTVLRDVHVSQISGYDQVLTFSASGLPSGASATFQPDSLTAPGESQLLLTGLDDAGAGTYTVSILGESIDFVRQTDFDLTVYADSAPAPTPMTPGNGELEVPRTPTFEWNPVPGALSYRVEVARDAAFTHLVAEHETGQTAWTIPGNRPLATNVRYWWRVIARNPCGDSASPSAGNDDVIFVHGFESLGEVRSFVTVRQMGDCPAEVPQQRLFADDVESGINGWLPGAQGTDGGWRISAGNAHQGQAAWQVDAVDSGSSQWLITPVIDLPADLVTTSLSFWNRQSILGNSTGTCFHGAVLDVSVDDGVSWQPVDDGLLTDPHDGVISSAWGNPMAGRNAWCGNPQNYLRSVVDLQPWAGQSVRLRFSLSSDDYAPAANPAWVIDDVRVTACPTP